MRLRYTFTEVVEMTRLSKAIIRQRIKAGLFPAPIDRGREFIFNATDIDKMLNPQSNAQVLKEFDRDEFIRKIAATRGKNRKKSGQALLCAEKGAAGRLAVVYSRPD